MFLSRRACVQRQTFANSRRPTERRRQCPNFSSAAPRSNRRKKPKNSVFDFDFSASSTQDGNSSEHIGCSVHTNGCAILKQSDVLQSQLHRFEVRSDAFEDSFERAQPMLSRKLSSARFYHHRGFERGQLFGPFGDPLSAV